MKEYYYEQLTSLFNKLPQLSIKDLQHVVEMENGLVQRYGDFIRSTELADLLAELGLDYNLNMVIPSHEVQPIILGPEHVPGDDNPSEYYNSTEGTVKVPDYLKYNDKPTSTEPDFTVPHRFDSDIYLRNYENPVLHFDKLVIDKDMFKEFIKNDQQNITNVIFCITGNN